MESEIKKYSDSSYSERLLLREGALDRLMQSIYDSEKAAIGREREIRKRLKRGIFITGGWGAIRSLLKREKG